MACSPLRTVAGLTGFAALAFAAFHVETSFLIP
jgi:hypothetical protein